MPHFISLSLCTTHLTDGSPLPYHCIDCTELQSLSLSLSLTIFLTVGFFVIRSHVKRHGREIDVVVLQMWEEARSQRVLQPVQLNNDLKKVLTHPTGATDTDEGMRDSKYKTLEISYLRHSHTNKTLPVGFRLTPSHPYQEFIKQHESWQHPFHAESGRWWLKVRVTTFISCQSPSHMHLSQLFGQLSLFHSFYLFKTPQISIVHCYMLSMHDVRIWEREKNWSDFIIGLNMV